MNISRAKYLSLKNWSLYSKISFSVWKNETKLSRLYLIIPVLISLACSAYFVNNVVSLWIHFLMSLFFLEMGKVFNRCCIDPIHLFYLGDSYSTKLREILIAELLGIKLLSFVLFSMVALMGSFKLVAFSILILLYCFFTILFVFVFTMGNRVRITSILYQWALIVVFSMLFGFSGISSTNSEAIFKMQLDFLAWISTNFVFGLTVLILALTCFYYLGCFFTKKIYETRPFINPDSFPRKMI